MLRRRTVVLILGATLVAGIGARSLRRAILPTPLDRCTSRRFDGRAWAESPQVHSPVTPRLCMVDDLLRRHALVGLTRDEAVALLGRPTDTSHFREYALVYYLGAEGGLAGIDSRWLLLRVDSTGRVAERRVASD